MPFLKVPMPPPDYNLRTVGVSQSIMNSWGCRQKMALVLNRWRLLNTSGTFYGTAFHDSFETMHKAGLTSFSLKRFLKELAESQRKAMKDVRSQQVMDKLAADYKLMAIVFPEYVAYHKDDVKKAWLKLEGEFDYTWLDKYRLRGKIDGVYKDKKGKNWIIEHKTKSRIDEEVLQKVLTFNFQNLFYIMACERQFNIKISGVLYDVIRKPGSKPHVNETEKDYAARLVKEIRKDPKHYFKRMELIYSEKERTLFETELKYKLEEMQAVLDNRLPVYRNECLCERPFACEFLDACSSGTMSGLDQKDTLFAELNTEEE